MTTPDRRFATGVNKTMSYELKPNEILDASGTIVTRHLGRDVNGTIIASCKYDSRPEPPPRLKEMFAATAARRPPVPHRTLAYHVQTGAVEMPTIDANAAVKNHPSEWSLTPWPASVPSARPSAARRVLRDVHVGLGRFPARLSTIKGEPR